MSSLNDRKIQILCLHGYRQNAKMFKDKIGSFRKMFKNEMEFHFIDAPNIIPNTENERGWWVKDTDLPCPSGQTSNCHGFEDSLNYVADFYQNEGRFDGILGFSQGAAFSAILCSILSEGGLNAGLKFVILIAGYKSSSSFSVHSGYFKQSLHVPSLHVIGVNDKVVAKERGEELRDCFDKSCTSTIMHDGGHYVPAKKQDKPLFMTFLEKYAS